MFDIFKTFNDCVNVRIYDRFFSFFYYILWKDESMNDVWRMMMMVMMMKKATSWQAPITVKTIEIHCTSTKSLTAFITFSWIISIKMQHLSLKPFRIVCFDCISCEFSLKIPCISFTTWCKRFFLLFVFLVFSFNFYYTINAVSLRIYEII